MASGDTPAEITQRVQAKRSLQNWIELERRMYADDKQATKGGRGGGELKDGLINDHCILIVVNYLNRALRQGSNTPQGRQLLGKAIVTLLDYTEQAIIYQGSMPKPGVPSGEIIEWT